MMSILGTINRDHSLSQRIQRCGLKSTAPNCFGLKLLLQHLLPLSGFIMPDPKAIDAQPPDASPPEQHLNGLLWEARADTGELTQLGGEAQAILGGYAELGKPRFSIEMFHGDDRDRVAAIVTRVLSTGEPAVFDARIIGAGPEPMWVRNAIRTVQHDSGLHVRGVSFDISDLKRAQSEFLRARARLSFLAAVNRHLSESLDYETTL